MKKNLGLSLAVAVVFMFTTSAYADPWLDEVVSWNDVEPLAPSTLTPEVIFGEVDISLTLSADDELKVAFIDNYAFDGPGDDIRLWENVDASNETLIVYASSDNVKYVRLADATNDESYDLADYEGLDTVKYFWLIGNSMGGSTPGYELQGIEALNSKPVASPCAGVPSSTLGVNRVYGTFDLGKHMAYFLVPMGAVIGLRMWRRKK